MVCHRKDNTIKALASGPIAVDLRDEAKEMNIAYLRPHFFDPHGPNLRRRVSIN